MSIIYCIYSCWIFISTNC